MIYSILIQHQRSARNIINPNESNEKEREKKKEDMPHWISGRQIDNVDEWGLIKAHIVIVRYLFMNKYLQMLESEEIVTDKLKGHTGD